MGLDSRFRAIRRPCRRGGWLRAAAFVVISGGSGALVTVGCSSSDPSPQGAAGSGGAPSCEVGVMLPSGKCVAAGVPPEMCGEGFTPDGKQGCEPVLPPGDCPDGTMPMIGKTVCQPVGVPADHCAVGFSSDGKGGCDPILPTAECPAGQMAIPGETACHEPHPCGTGTWGDIPIQANTQFVDASHAGGDSDGSMAKPWTTVTEGVAHAAIGAVVAVAAGSYVENVTLSKGISLWGVCPSKVSVTGASTSTSTATATVTVSGLPEGQVVEVHGLGVTGPTRGIEVEGAIGVILDGLWIHDTGGNSEGIYMTHTAGPASLTLTSSLIEATHARGVLIEATEGVIDRSVIRGTLPQLSDKTRGRGIQVQNLLEQRARLTLTRSVLSRNQNVALIAFGSDLSVQGTIIRETQPVLKDMTGGRAIEINDDSGQRSVLALTASLVDGNRDRAVLIAGSDATVLDTVVRNTHSRQSDGDGGLAIEVINHVFQRSTLTLTTSLLDQSHGAGLRLIASNGTVEGTIIRNTQPQDTDMTAGWGILIKNDNDQRTTLQLTSSLVEHNHTLGIFAQASDLTIQGTVVRTTQPDASDGTDGIGIEVDDNDGLRSTVSLSSSLLDQNQAAGLFVTYSNATVQGTVIRNTQPQQSDMQYGFGISVQDDGSQPHSFSIDTSVLDQNQDVGMYLVQSNAVVKATVIRNTAPQQIDQTFGDGISASLCQLSVESTLIEKSARASVSNFGSNLTLTQVQANCAFVLFDEEIQPTDPYTAMPITPVNGVYHPHQLACFECDASPTSCKAVSKNLAPPKPVRAIGSAATQSTP